MKQRSILGRVAVPLLIYYGISLVITMFASAIVAGLKMPQYLNGQVEYAQMVTEMTNEILKYTTIITGVTAIVAIPIFGGCSTKITGSEDRWGWLNQRKPHR